MQPLLLSFLFGGALTLWWGLLSARFRTLGAGAALLGAALILMIGLDAVDPWVLPALAGMAALCGSLKVIHHRGWQIIGWGVYVLIVLALGFRVFPQLRPLLVFEALETTTYHTFQFPPEKLLLMLLLPTMVLSTWKPVSPISLGEATKRFLLVLAATLLVVLPLGVALSYVSPGLTTASVPYLGYWLTYNLVFVCILEESFFRGILQDGLLKGFRQRRLRHAGPLAILVTALLFGLVHTGGGPVLVLLATLAGVGYGAAYYLTGRLYCAVWLHFTVNAVHQLGFAGPVG